jgi:hypothetical protein
MRKRTRKKMTRVRFRDERGVAMVTALLVMFVVLLLSVAVVTTSIHNTTSSAYDRRRVLAVQAAEAGIDWYYHHLSVTGPESLSCAATGTVDSGPNTAEWSASIELEDASGSPLVCPLPFGITPSGAMITSEGRSPTGTLLRTMQSYVEAKPIFEGTGAAILAFSPTSITNKLTIISNEGDEADIFVSCPSSPCSLSLSNNQTISGNLYVLGSVSLSNSVVVQGDVWARDGVTMGTGATVIGDVLSSTGSISVSSPASIGGDATAGTTVADQSLVGGTVLENTVSPDPPSYTMPQFEFDATEQAAWEVQQYEIRTFTDCTTAKTFIEAFGSVPINVFGTYNYVARITAVCNLEFSNNITINMPGSLTIVTDGSITTSNNITWRAVGNDRTLYLASRYRTGLTCSSGAYNISTTTNTNFLNIFETPRLDVLMYSPCSVILRNQNAFSGQVVANTVDVSNQTTINFVPVAIPGVTAIIGFTQEPQYLREVK